ncbi:excalibur calcium-binding domain-containing protein [Stenotrophomonas sp. HITSZ_GD]|uniref:excalibur calcium-binding domain-containing protein n=1 Tax=Stenotrophomonas sp. HITSZ_GD TaxID=3037248 RepID=UPI00240D5904|nr:excalibur calcium-binding domain-containing protein [Stenotrophomonas sp. HITSZ_GD]MDG2525946.1 excalibur calcium-binding domain-containing protein [Stenotrophomonas sp. HITSZ_GD]
MRTYGTLTRWNDERGFGFIAPAQGGDEVFVHISALPRDGQRPRISEVLTFETEPGPDGRPRAVRVLRPGQAAHAARRHGPPARRSAPRSRVALPLVCVVLGAIGFYVYSRWEDATETRAAAAAPLAAAQRRPSSFHCDGRTHCSQMTSCAEAKYFIRHCPNTQMDGDGDGVPCEQQWCR